ncbi:hypothetical protein PtA15_2A803 [Puccinia triticina]|uniref:Uncharacterized protein n=1 Tax=Puccinia triticina TaxID=208348 RepID=A0ABY7CBA6_9BASI|nr:uncharacterized protein PtA15_2A803 [Puccinia triticina]WAQ82486.1 hypothetical protein PtA15_2A803 [Puccinia triticina]
MKGTGAGLPEHIQTNNAAGGPTPSQTLVFLTNQPGKFKVQKASISASDSYGTIKPGEPSTVSVATNEDGPGDDRTSVPRKLVSGGHVVDPKAEPGWDEWF